MREDADITEALADDFTTVNYLLAKVTSIPAEAPALRRIWYSRVKDAIVQHVHCEEAVLRSVLDDNAGASPRIEDTCDDHALIAQLLWHLDSIPADESGWETLVDELRDRWVQHHLETEAHLFALLESLFDTGTLRALGNRLRETAAAFRRTSSARPIERMVV